MLDRKSGRGNITVNKDGNSAAAQSVPPPPYRKPLSNSPPGLLLASFRTPKPWVVAARQWRRRCAAPSARSSRPLRCTFRINRKRQWSQSPNRYTTLTLTLISAEFTISLIITKSAFFRRKRDFFSQFTRLISVLVIEVPEVIEPR